MNITRIRQAEKANRMGVLIDELARKDDVPGPLAALRLQYALKTLQRCDYAGYKAYDILRDYLGLGDEAPYMLSAMEYYYPGLANKPGERLSYDELDKTCTELLEMLRTSVFESAGSERSAI